MRQACEDQHDADRDRSRPDRAAIDRDDIQQDARREAATVRWLPKLTANAATIA